MLLSFCASHGDGRVLLLGSGARNTCLYNWTAATIIMDNGVVSGVVVPGGVWVAAVDRLVTLSGGADPV